MSRRVTEGLAAVRRREGAALVVAFGVGLGIAVYHYAGLLVGGALVGAVSRSTGRALLFGTAFGVVVWVVFAGSLFAHGVLPKYVVTGRVFALSAALAVVPPALAASVRGLL